MLLGASSGGFSTTSVILGSFLSFKTTYNSECNAKFKENQLECKNFGVRCKHPRWRAWWQIISKIAAIFIYFLFQTEFLIRTRSINYIRWSFMLKTRVIDHCQKNIDLNLRLCLTTWFQYGGKASTCKNFANYLPVCCFCVSRQVRITLSRGTRYIVLLVCNLRVTCPGGHTVNTCIQVKR